MDPLVQDLVIDLLVQEELDLHDDIATIKQAYHMAVTLLREQTVIAAREKQIREIRERELKKATELIRALQRDQKL